MDVESEKQGEGATLGRQPQLWLSWSPQPLTSLFYHRPLTSCITRCRCAHFPSYHPVNTHTQYHFLLLINTHINHPKHRCDKPIINLHRQVQYSDNEFSGYAADSIRSLTADGCSNDCSMSPGYSTAIDEVRWWTHTHVHTLSHTHTHTQRVTVTEHKQKEFICLYH